MGSLPQPELHERLAPILAICERMNSERELGPLLELIARETAALLDCERAGIFLLDRERGELWSKAAPGSDEIFRFDASQGAAGHAAATGEVVNVRDASSDARYGARTVLAVALRTEKGEISGAVEALDKRAGVFTRRDEEALTALAGHAANAIETAQLIAELRRELGRRHTSHGIIGSGPKIQQVARLIERIRDSVVNVLVTGESGSGKELTVKAIHYASPRARKPFVALNCAALPEMLAESALFGIEKADGGTLFLDEIGDLSLAAQAKILRVLEEPVDVRLLAATSKDLESEIARGAFREDLYYRLKVVHIHVPPLREMREDIPLLAHHFLNEYCREAGRAPLEFSAAVLRKLNAAPWPGNVRQLRNEVIRLAVCARGGVIEDEDLGEGAPSPRRAQPATSRAARPQSLKAAVESLEREMVAGALAATKNNQQQAARTLGLSRQGLINKIKRYRLGA